MTLADALQFVEDFFRRIEFVGADVHHETAAVGNHVVGRSGEDLRDMEPDFSHFWGDARKAMPAQAGNVVHRQVEGVDSVAAGGVVNGTVTVNGAEVDVSKGGAWTGDIVIAPAAGSGEPSGDATGGIVPGTYGALTVNPDMTFTMQKTGQNLEGTEFVLTVSGVVENGEFVLTSLSDGMVELIEMATEDQKAADLASVYAAYNG